MTKNLLYNYSAYKFFLQHKKLKGGSVIEPDWLNKFLEELDNIYDSNYVITGSSAIVLYLNYFNKLTKGKFNDSITTLKIPNDIDFLYYCKGTNYESKRKIGKFTRLQDSPQRSVTYQCDFELDIPNIIKSFDLTCSSMISYVLIDKYKLLSFYKLLDYYSTELEDQNMLLDSNKSKLVELELSLETHKNNISKLLEIDSEKDNIESTIDKIKNKIMTLESKINIINILNDNIKIDSTMEAVYNLKYIPEKHKKSFSKLSSDDQKISSFDTLRNINFEDSYNSQNTERPNIFNDDLFSTSLTPVKKPSIPLITPPPQNKITPIKYVTVPYNIKFDFEKDL